jgi:hypothetical protein
LDDIALFYASNCYAYWAIQTSGDMRATLCMSSVIHL